MIPRRFVMLGRFVIPLSAGLASWGLRRVLAVRARRAGRPTALSRGPWAQKFRSAGPPGGDLANA
eukprot:1549001-Pyramimonas_sp.AAC.1